MSSSGGYQCRKINSALGIAFEVKGPGIDDEEAELIPIQPLNDWAKQCLTEYDYTESQARLIVKLLTLAFEAGKNERK